MRRKQVLNMRRAGISYSAIGHKLGITGERVRQIINSQSGALSKPSKASPSLKTSEVAHLLNVHINTVRRWSKKGILQGFRIGPRGDRRFKREEINRLSNNSR